MLPPSFILGITPLSGILISWMIQWIDSHPDEPFPVPLIILGVCCLVLLVGLCLFCLGSSPRDTPPRTRPLQTFHPFPRLPIELQQHIFRLAINMHPKAIDLAKIQFYMDLPHPELPYTIRDLLPVRSPTTGHAFYMYLEHLTLYIHDTSYMHLGLIRLMRVNSLAREVFLEYWINQITRRVAAGGKAHRQLMGQYRIWHQGSQLRMMLRGQREIYGEQMGMCRHVQMVLRELLGELRRPLGAPMIEITAPEEEEVGLFALGYQRVGPGRKRRERREDRERRGDGEHDGRRYS